MIGEKYDARHGQKNGSIATTHRGIVNILLVLLLFIPYTGIISMTEATSPCPYARQSVGAAGIHDNGVEYYPNDHDDNSNYSYNGSSPTGGLEQHQHRESPPVAAAREQQRPVPTPSLVGDDNKITVPRTAVGKGEEEKSSPGSRAVIGDDGNHYQRNLADFGARGGEGRSNAAPPLPGTTGTQSSPYYPSVDDDDDCDLDDDRGAIHGYPRDGNGIIGRSSSNSVTPEELKEMLGGDLSQLPPELKQILGSSSGDPSQISLDQVDIKVIDVDDASQTSQLPPDIQQEIGRILKGERGGSGNDSLPKPQPKVDDSPLGPQIEGGNSQKPQTKVDDGSSSPLGPQIGNSYPPKEPPQVQKVGNDNNLPSPQVTTGDSTGTGAEAQVPSRDNDNTKPDAKEVTGTGGGGGAPTEKIQQPPAGSGKSGAFSVRRGKGHDVRDPGYWTRDRGKASLDSCRALSNEENLNNAFLYLSNVARCEDNVQAALSWDNTLEEDATTMAQALVEFMAQNDSRTERGVRINIQGKGRASTQYTAESMLSTKSWNDAMSRVKSPHLPIPYRVAGDARGGYVPTGQNLLYSYIASVGYSSDSNGVVTPTIFAPSESVAKHLSGYISLADVEYSLADLQKWGENEGNGGVNSKVLSVIKDNGSIKPEETINNIVNQIPNGGRSGAEIDAERAYPLSYLRKEYLGGPSDLSDLSKVTMSASEYMAAHYYIDMYLRERETLRRTVNLDTIKNGRYTHTESGNYPVGHYTQMIWGSTRKIGCGCADYGGPYVCVCSYYPSGNVSGEILSSTSGSPNITYTPEEQMRINSAGYERTGASKDYFLALYNSGGV